ncbi:MAG TPA: RICIN domain-containing protein [Spirochaetota bacterium]|nr:RICIN domain-containing protein [Spirochaetota bacterium]
MKNNNPLTKVTSFIAAALILAFISHSVYAGGGTDILPANRYFYIKSVQAGSQNLGYWDQSGSPEKFKKGDNLALYAKDEGADQQFMFINAGSGYYYIKAKNGGIVDVAGNSKKNGTNVHIWSGHGGPNQLFRFKHLGGGKWKIYAKNGTVLCTPENYRNGANVHIREDQNNPWMEWYLEDAITGKKYAPSREKEK